MEAALGGGRGAELVYLGSAAAVKGVTFSFSRRDGQQGFQFPAAPKASAAWWSERRLRALKAEHEECPGLCRRDSNPQGLRCLTISSRMRQLFNPSCLLGTF